MGIKSRLIFAGLLAIAQIIPNAALANDSEAETSLGGLLLKQSSAVSMDSEDLYISAYEIRVKYRFTNTSDEDVKTLISFPLPLLPVSSGGEVLYEATPDLDALKFTTTVNGKLAPLNRVIRAMSGAKDVTQKVEALGWPINWIGEYEFIASFDKMTDDQRAPLVKQGLIRKVENYDKKWVPGWQIARHVTREQTFPAGKTISVEHSYEPLIGGSVGGTLNKSYRDSEPAFLKAYQERYCVDDYFLKGFDRRSIKSQIYSETWIGYILSSGANWKGPIKDFRIVVDKGNADNLVSFCMNGIKKIGPTTFEVRKQNFEPKDDLNILIVEWFNPEG